MNLDHPFVSPLIQYHLTVFQASFGVVIRRHPVHIPHDKPVTHWAQGFYLQDPIQITSPTGSNLGKTSRTPNYGEPHSIITKLWVGAII